MVIRVAIFGVVSGFENPASEEAEGTRWAGEGNTYLPEKIKMM